MPVHSTQMLICVKYDIHINVAKKMTALSWIPELLAKFCIRVHVKKFLLEKKMGVQVLEYNKGSRHILNYR